MSHVDFHRNKIWCSLCEEHEKFLKIQTAATLLEVNRRTIYRYVEEGKIYSVKTVGGTLRVCSGCLVKPNDD